LPRLAVALDAPALEPLEPLLDELAGLPVLAKVGPALFTAVGPSVVHHLHAAGFAVFLDLGLLDLPSQVALAVSVAARLDVALLSVHASGGAAMLRAASAARSGSLRLCGTLWPSGSPANPVVGTGGALTHAEILRQREQLCVECGLDGVMAGAADLGDLVARPAPWLRVAVGVRPHGQLPGDDQCFGATPHQALQAGASLLVVGRPLLHAPAPRQTAEELLAEIDRYDAAWRNVTCQTASHP
jgi:orotidine-5'-phosphate decarboxylase